MCGSNTAPSRITPGGKRCPAPPYCASGKTDLLEVKCDPLLASGLRRTPGILPAYHMNKEHWLGILLGGPLPEETIRQLIGLSYELTRQKAGKKPSAAPKRRET